MNFSQKGTFMAFYFAKLKKLWGDLAYYEQIALCDCDGVMVEPKKTA